jgi:hypothetical protein
MGVREIYPAIFAVRISNILLTAQKEGGGMNNLCKGCRITRTDFLSPFATCNHEGAADHCLPEYQQRYEKPEYHGVVHINADNLPAQKEGKDD